MPEPVSLREDGVIVFVEITKASIAADTSCVPGARKVPNQCLRKSWSLKQGGSGRGAINVPNFAKHLQIRRNHPTFQKHHEDHQSARSCTRRPSGTSERRPAVSRPVPRAEHSSPPRAFVRSVAVVTPCQCRHTLISDGVHSRPRFKIETTCVIGTCHMQSFHRSMFPTCLGSGCGD